MSGQYTTRLQAELDLVDLADYISQESLEAAERFLTAVEHTYKLLADTPMIGQECGFSSPRAAGLRVWPVRQFPNHLVYYRPAESGIDVVRVLHGARDIERALDQWPLRPISMPCFPFAVATEW